MKDLESNQIIVLLNWLARLGFETDSFIKFITLWFVFNAWLVNIAPDRLEFNERESLSWFYDNDSNLKKWAMIQLARDEIQQVLGELKKLSPISNRKREVDVLLSDTTSLQQVMDFIYQIRCNLFHGYKNPRDDADKLLVEFSSQFLWPWLNNALNDEKVAI